MKKVKYSKFDKIPKGIASDKIVNGCLVLEGGGYRGIYGEGVIDAFMENDINFSCVIGVSAGALMGMNYVSGQIGRSARANLGHRFNSQMIGWRAFKESKSFLNIDFLLNTYNKWDKFNKERFHNGAQRFIAVATNCKTGKPEYFEKGKCEDIYNAVKASASLPYISPMVMVEGKPYLDGGCSCKIAYEWAMDQNFDKIVVIKTRDVDYRKPSKKLSVARKFYRKYPQFAKSLENSNFNYNRQCEEIEVLHMSGKLYRVAPQEPVTVGRVEKDIEKLGDLYFQGYKDGLDQIDNIKAYCGI